jgi:hypothetical protein
MNQTSVMSMTIDFNESVFGATKVNLIVKSDCLIPKKYYLRNLQRK